MEGRAGGVVGFAADGTEGIANHEHTLTWGEKKKRRRKKGGVKCKEACRGERWMEV